MKTKKDKSALEPRVPVSTSIFGLASVHKSSDPTWVRWCVMYPGNRTTEWYRTPKKAHAVADKFNNGKK